MQYKRDISNKITRIATQFPVIVLTGARQVGKTTLLRSLFPTHSYVSLDLPSAAESAENEPREFLKRYPPPLVVDEVQYAPKLLRALKIVVDERRHEMGKYILTGSQKFPLMKEVAESLAGRAAILELEGLNLHEVGTQNDWPIVLVRGMYPELWRQPELHPVDFYSSYLSTYLERDVRQILNVASLRDFERFLRATAIRSGQLINRTEISRDVGISSKTVGEWLGVLQASNQILILEPYFENVGKRLIKSPKLYFHDTGLLCFLLGLDRQSVTQSPLIGAIWETFVYAELRKQIHQSEGATQSIWFYRDSHGRELDFLRLNRGKMDLLECKWSETPDRKWIASVHETGDQLSRSRAYELGSKMIVCRTEIPHPVDGVRLTNPNQLSQ